MKKSPHLPPQQVKPTIGGIIDRPPGDLKPRAGNARKHSEMQLTKLAAGMSHFGFTIPVLIDEHDVILSGHARVPSEPHTLYSQIRLSGRSPAAPGCVDWGGLCLSAWMPNHRGRVRQPPCARQ